MPMRISVYAEFENGPYVMRVNKKSVNEATRSNRHLRKRNKHRASLYRNNHRSDEFRRSTLFHRLNTPNQMRRDESASPLSPLFTTCVNHGPLPRRRASCSRSSTRAATFAPESPSKRKGIPINPPAVVSQWAVERTPRRCPLR